MDLNVIQSIMQVADKLLKHASMKRSSIGHATTSHVRHPTLKLNIPEVEDMIGDLMAVGATRSTALEIASVYRDQVTALAHAYHLTYTDTCTRLSQSFFSHDSSALESLFATTLKNKFLGVISGSFTSLVELTEQELTRSHLSVINFSLNRKLNQVFLQLHVHSSKLH